MKKQGRKIPMKHFSAALLVACALTSGCDNKSTTTPTPTGTPTPTPTPTPLPTAPPLSGFVRDTFTDAPLANAKVEIVDAGSGQLTGNFVLTDAAGRYSFFGISGSQSFRASREGYEGEPRRLHLALTSTHTFNLVSVLNKPPRETILPAETKMGTVDGGDATCGGMFFVLPCKRFILVVSEGATLKVRLTWATAHDVDLELWRDDTLIDKSLICQACGLGSPIEEFTRFVPAGEYELRATLFAGTGSPASFSLSVTRVN